MHLIWWGREGVEESTVSKIMDGVVDGIIVYNFIFSYDEFFVNDDSKSRYVKAHLRKNMISIPHVLFIPRKIYAQRGSR